VLGGIGLTVLFGGPVGAATTSPLAPFLLKSHEEPGFTVSGHPSTITKPSGLIASGSLTKSESMSFVSTLQKAGFVQAVEESTKGSGSNEGLSLVIQFSDPAGAQAGAALFLQVAKSGQTGTKLFSVAGVPGARGVTGRGGRIGKRVLVGRRLRLWLRRLRSSRDVGEGRGLTGAGRNQGPGQASRHDLPLAGRDPRSQARRLVRAENPVGALGSQRECESLVGDHRGPVFVPVRVCARRRLVIADQCLDSGVVRVGCHR
jgi:hypothetical protein